MIWLFPMEGLCNRMRAIASAMALSEACAVPLNIYWLREEKLNCKYSDLFEDLSSAKVFEVTGTPLLMRHAKLKNIYLYGVLRKLLSVKLIDNDEVKVKSECGCDFTEIRSRKIVAIKTYHDFFDGERYYPLFKPVNALHRKIEETARAFNQNTIGVHIRRKETNLFSINSPLQAFVENMEDEIAKNPRTNFYLATDCCETKRILLDKFGKRIMACPRQSRRDTPEGIQDALVDLFCLSKTSKIYRTYWSSFSETAVKLSGVAGVTVRQDRQLAAPGN